MPIFRKLSPDEFVVVSTRTHLKALLVPAAVLMVLAGAAGYLSTIPSGDARIFLQWVIWGVAALAILWLVVRPFLSWLTTTYTVTNRRVITRSGLLTRRGHEVPMDKIIGISYERGLLDRVWGSGTLVVSDASEHGRVVLHDLPRVEQVQHTITERLFDGSRESPADPSAHRADDRG